jgi:hypothetical protein
MTRVDDIREAGRNELVATTTTVSTVQGELVAEIRSTVVSRGTAVEATQEAE